MKERREPTQGTSTGPGTLGQAVPRGSSRVRALQGGSASLLS